MNETVEQLAGLRARYERLLGEQPAMRIRNAAAALGVSELELLVLDMPGRVTRLRPDFKELLATVGALGEVMALTRNDDVVHERHGTYVNPDLGNGPVGLFVGEEIDLRIFWRSWAHAFAVREPGRGGERHSLQCFAHDGSAIHKIYLTDASDAGAFHAMVERFLDADQSSRVSVVQAPPVAGELPDSAVDVGAFQEGWLGLQDTHDFHMLLGRHRLSRTQALRLAPPGGYAVPVAPAALRAVLTTAAQDATPIMVFVGNPGMLQIHTGPIVNVVDARGWLNVLDARFNLHVREEAITQAWVVRKPTRDGMVTALECFNGRGEQVVQLFGKRKPGLPELEEWRSLIAGVEKQYRA